MTRQTRRPRLDVQESFETTRLSPKCLIEAYIRVVPVQRTTLRKAERDAVTPQAAPAPRRGGKHA
jgi:hypothetical protein